MIRNQLIIILSFVGFVMPKIHLFAQIPESTIIAYSIDSNTIERFSRSPLKRVYLTPLSPDISTVFNNYSNPTSIWQSLGLPINNSDLFVDPIQDTGPLLGGLSLTYAQNYLFSKEIKWFNLVTLQIGLNYTGNNLLYSYTHIENVKRTDTLYVGSNELIGYIDSIGNNSKQLNYSFQQAGLDISFSYPAGMVEFIVGSAFNVQFNCMSTLNQYEYTTYALNTPDYSYAAILSIGDTITTATNRQNINGFHMYPNAGIQLNPTLNVFENNNIQLVVPIRFMLGFDIYQIPEYGFVHEFNMRFRAGIGLQFIKE
ncbi:MAG: hypothetical protein IPI65_15415 [Bacteroidetes bacterium]|nr:hypothetical protein [Bacteroidota bacterium]